MELKEKRHYLVTIIDFNNVAISETYSASDVINLFMIIAKEMMHRELEYGLKKLIVEEITSSE